MKIFISYAHQYAELANEIFTLLAQDRHVPFLDQHALAPGQEYTQHIRGKIAHADMFIFLLTPESVRKGSYARFELELMQELVPDASGRLLPVMVAPTPMEQIPAYARSVSIYMPEGNVAAGVVWQVSKLAGRSPLGWSRYLARGRAVPATAAVLGLAAMPVLLASVLDFGPSWPSSTGLTVGVALLAAILGFLLALLLSSVSSARARLPLVGLSVLLLGASFAAYLVDVRSHVASMGTFRVLTLPLDAESAQPEVLAEILAAVNPKEPNYETPQAALQVFRDSRGYEPEIVWKPERIHTVEIRILMLWGAMHLALALVLWLAIFRPAPAPPRA